MHLQSGRGLEDAALVQAGAKSVVGVDYSGTAAGAAQQRADELGLACRYIVGALLGVPLADGTADLVYTGKGALMWMPDLGAWAREAARLLCPGGHLFVHEGHPAVPLWTWDEDIPAPGRRQARKPRQGHALLPGVGMPGGSRRVPARPAAAARHVPGRRGNVPGRARRPCAGRCLADARLPGPRRDCLMVPARRRRPPAGFPGAGTEDAPQSGQTVRPGTQTLFLVLLLVRCWVVYVILL